MQTITEDDFVNFIGKQESQYIVPASSFVDGVLDRLSGEPQALGDSLPWSKTYSKVRLRPGEISVWAGVNGHGKSQLLNMVCAFALNKSKWLIASLEMKPDATMYRMTRQISGVRDVNPDYALRFMSWTDDKLWIYDQLDTVESERIIGMIHYAAQELKINHIIIDSLMKCGIGSDDYNTQKGFVDRLCWAAKSENIHIHLVAHVRKGNHESDIPDKFDIKGCSEITDMVDNVFIVHRNKGKEEKIRMNKATFEDEQQPDCTLKVAKQRHGEWEGNFLLWFHGDSMQYTPDIDNRPLPFGEI